MRAPLPFLAPVLLFTALAGCSSYGLVKPDPPPAFARAAPPHGLATVCILRPHWVASAVTYVVHDNGQLVGATRGPTWFCWHAGPGAHLVTSEADDLMRDVQELRSTLAPDTRYYIHEIATPVGHWIKWVGPAEGEEMIGKCGYRVLVSAPARDPLPSATPPVVGALRQP